MGTSRPPLPEIVPVATLRDNYVWVILAADAAWVIDPGEATPVAEFLQAVQRPLAGILLTHRHWDHVDGVAELLGDRPLPVWGPDSDAMPMVNRRLCDGDSLSIAGSRLEVLATPGHTPEHISYFWPDHGALFCGDTLFSAGCGRLLGGTAEQLWSSLTRLRKLPGATRIYCTHEYTLANLAFALEVEPGNPELVRHLDRCNDLRQQGLPTLPTSVALECAINPFLRCDQQAVVTAVDHRRGRAAGSGLGETSSTLHGTPLEIFTFLRQWKDRY